MLSNNAYSPSKETAKDFLRPAQNLSINNSATLPQSNLSQELPKFVSIGTPKVENKSFTVWLRLLKNLVIEVSRFGRSKNVESVDNTFAFQNAAYHKFLFETERLISQYQIYYYLSKNSLKEDEKYFEQALVKRGLHNALVPENEVKIQSLFDAASNEIDEYSTFEENWDGYKAKSFKQETVFLAKRILNDVKTNLIVENFVPDEITPGPASDGSLAIEILHMTKDLIITILPNTVNEIVIYTNDGVINKETSISYPSDLRIYFEWLAADKL